MEDAIIIDVPRRWVDRRGDGDTIDRLSATTTVRILFVASIFATAGPYLAHPIQCFVPAEMTDAMHQYVEKYCYIRDTYIVPHDEYLPQLKSSVERNGARVVSYYLWVPFILNLQALMFYAPRFFWRLASGVMGVNFNAMITMAHNCLLSRGNLPTHLCYQDLADYIDCCLNLRQAARRRSSEWNIYARYSDLYLVAVFLFTKLLYVTNAVGQIFLLSAFLQTNDPFYGVTMARNLINGTQWQQSGFFPRSTLCDVEIRNVANTNRYTVQCALLINFFNEKLFIFLWFWTGFVAIVSACGLVFWLLSMFFAGIRRCCVRRLLPELPTEKDHPLADYFSKFVDDF